ncbi:ABC transporter permease [Streptomyces sp. NPDC051976]|uniref:ABC transporter permease n=1 Tax=Streptomyces sp. NPDC051976 TaxID=3154947 RepID=UPI00343777AB
MRTLLQAVRGNGKAIAGLLILLLFALMALVPNIIAPGDPAKITQDASLDPSAAHPLGTTGFGQDVLVQVVHGARPALLIAVVAGLLATVLSVLVGVTAAYLGGFWDDVLNLLTDVVLVIPTLPLVVVIAAYFAHHSISVMIIALVVTGWSYGARQLRVQALSLRNRDFLEAARVRGERSSYIIVFELLPNMTSLIVANFLGSALYSILTASGLEFLGLGDVNTYDWGTMLYWAQNQSALQTGSYLWAAVPGLCIALLGTAFALLNNAFDELGNPALRPIRKVRRAAA